MIKLNWLAVERLPPCGRQRVNAMQGSLWIPVGMSHSHWHRSAGVPAGSCQGSAPGPHLAEAEYTQGRRFPADISQARLVGEPRGMQGKSTTGGGDLTEFPGKFRPFHPGFEGCFGCGGSGYRRLWYFPILRPLAMGLLSRLSDGLAGRDNRGFCALEFRPSRSFSQE